MVLSDVSAVGLRGSHSTAAVTGANTELSANVVGNAIPTMATTVTDTDGADAVDAVAGNVTGLAIADNATSVTLGSTTVDLSGVNGDASMLTALQADAPTGYTITSDTPGEYTIVGTGNVTVTVDTIEVANDGSDAVVATAGTLTDVSIASSSTSVMLGSTAVDLTNVTDDASMLTALQTAAATQGNGYSVAAGTNAGEYTITSDGAASYSATTLATTDEAAGAFTVNGQSVNVSAGDDLKTVLSSISAATNGDVTGTLSANGRITLESVNGAAIKLEDIAGNSGLLGKFGLTAGTTQAKLGTDTSVTLNGTEIKLAKDSDMDSIVTAINTASTGVSAKNDNGQLSLSSQHNFTIADGAAGTGLAALGLTGQTGATAVTQETSVANLNITTEAGAQQAIQVLDGAMQQVDSERSKLGAVQNRFESTISNLQNIGENASAARARITDTDYAAESANLAKNQIMQQAGTAMLAQANQLPQAVLSLLG